MVNLTKTQTISPSSEVQSIAKVTPQTMRPPRDVLVLRRTMSVTSAVYLTILLIVVVSWQHCAAASAIPMLDGVFNMLDAFTSFLGGPISFFLG
uniref:Uncharacterized protein n=1 Tax=Timema bartmani TaxID=61472 RepID=A0A7R9F1V0_9NEOP|nr:unnamed protein product [Timema bartmani]